MILPDTKILLYAFRPEFPQHEMARQWMNAPVDLSIRFLSALDAARIAEAPNHDRVLSRLCSTHGIQGDGILDAWLAAFAITHGILLASHDKAFARFAPELEWIDPLAASATI